MRGASALQGALDGFPDAKLAVLVVWEPVIVTDLGPPGTRTLARVNDARARQFWDPDLSLSAAMLADARRRPDLFPEISEIDDEAVVWDVVATWPPGVRWESAMPPPAWHGFPVVDALPAFTARLSAAP